MSPKKDTRKAAKSATATDQRSKGLAGCGPAAGYQYLDDLSHSVSNQGCVTLKGAPLGLYKVAPGG